MRGGAVLWPLALLFLMMAGGSGSAQDGVAVHDVGLDLFQDVSPSDLRFVTGCDGGGFGQDAGSFWYHEQDPGAGSTVSATAGLPSGYLDTGCGTASTTVQVPAGMEHLHVRFQGDRQVEELRIDDGAPVQPNPDGLHFIQEVRLLGPDGATLASHPYFDGGAPASATKAIDPPAFILPAPLREVGVAWYFEDTGAEEVPGSPDFASGEAYTATVQDIRLEFSGVPAPVAVTEDDARQGTRVVAQTRVQASVPADLAVAYDVNVRVRVDGSYAFAYAVAPDGTVLDRTGTRTGQGPSGYAPEQVLVERFEDIHQATVPWGIVQEHGAGDYTLVFEQVQAANTVPALVPVAVLLMALPLPFAALAIRGAHAFEREAFGKFRRSARNLIVAVVVTFLYYVAVVLSAFAGGRLDLMTLWPAPLESVLLYVQVVVAGAAFVVLWRVADNLYRISRPTDPLD